MAFLAFCRFWGTFRELLRVFLELLHSEKNGLSLAAGVSKTSGDKTATKLVLCVGHERLSRGRSPRDGYGIKGRRWEASNIIYNIIHRLVCVGNKDSFGPELQIRASAEEGDEL